MKPTVRVRGRVRVSSVKQSRKSLKTIGRIISLTFMCLYALFSIVPLLWMVVGSFSHTAAIIGNSLPISWKAFVPIPFTTNGYSRLSSSGFLGAVLHTIFVAAVVVGGGLIVNSLAGYAFAMFRFRGKRVIFTFVMLTMALPVDVIALPLYVLVNDFGWVGTFTGLILPAVANGFTIFLFRQAVLGVPKTLIEAARVDGMSWLRIYLSVVIPLIRGSLIGGTLILMLAVWQSFLYPLLVGNTSSTELVQVAIAYFQTYHITYWNTIFAGSAVTIAVPTILLAFLQRYFRPSISSSGSK